MNDRNYRHDRQKTQRGGARESRSAIVESRSEAEFHLCHRIGVLGDAVSSHSLSNKGGWISLYSTRRRRPGRAWNFPTGMRSPREITTVYSTAPRTTRQSPDKSHCTGPGRLARSYLVRDFQSLLSSGLYWRTLTPVFCSVPSFGNCTVSKRLSQQHLRLTRKSDPWTSLALERLKVRFLHAGQPRSHSPF